MIRNMDEVCENCGLSYGSHHAGTGPWPRNYCPGHEGRMDWTDGPGTVFSPTGLSKTPRRGTPAMQRNRKKDGRKESQTMAQTDSKQEG